MTRIRPEDPREVTRQRIGIFLFALALSHLLPRHGLAAEDPPEADELARKAAELVEKGAFDAALPLAQRSLALREEALAPDSPAIAESLNVLGAVLQSKGQPRQALPLVVRSLAITEGAYGPDHQYVRDPLNLLANVYESLGRYGDALPLYRRSLAIHEQWLEPDSADVAMALNNLGELYRKMNEYEEALPLLQRSLAIREKRFGADHWLVANSLNNQALVYLYTGELDEALARFKQSLAIREKVLGPDNPALANALNNLAFTYRALGEFGDTVLLLQRGLAIGEKSLGPEHPTVAFTLNHLAVTYTFLGRPADALPLLQRALAIRERALGPDHSDVAQTLGGLAIAYRQLGRDAKVVECYEGAHAIYEKRLSPNHADFATSLSNLGVFHLTRGRSAEAMLALERSLAMREQVLGPEHRDVGNSLDSIARVYMNMRDYDAAIPLLQRAARIAVAAGDPSAAWSAQAGLRHAYARRGERPLAIFWGKLAVNTLQGLRAKLVSLDRDLQRSFLQDKRAVYTDLADLLIVEGRIDEAQLVITMLKEEEFFDFVRSEPVADPRTIEAALTGAEKALQDQFVALAGRLGSAAGEVTKLQRRKRFGTLDATGQVELAAAESGLVAARSDFDAFVKRVPEHLAAERATRGDALPRPSESHQALLATLGAAGRHVASVQYVVTGERTHIIVTTAAEQLARTVPIPQSRLNALVKSFREAVQDRRVDPRPLGRELHALLVAPVVDDLHRSGARTLILYLDGSLRYMPFAALVDGDRYLIEKFQLTIATDAARSRLTAERQPSWQVAAWGVTRAFPDQNFAALPGVRAELSGIVRPDVLPGTARLDDEFTLHALRASMSSPVLHIASHFRFVPGSETSFLLLGDGTHLTLRQVRKELPRFANVDLLTLSACETAMGSGVNESGLEVEGLGVLAQKHGAKAVLATLWPVADASTAVLMQEFYRNLRQPGRSKAGALREAQLGLLRGADQAPAEGSVERAARREIVQESHPAFAPDREAPYAHPYYWAPLILMGNWL